MKYKLNEIFYSLQGEGAYTGHPVIFIRFSGCNLKCSFCDTRHEDGLFQSKESILTLIEVNYPQCKRIVLTGGEPTLQVDDELIDFLHFHGYMIHIESNGTKPIQEEIDWITISPKENWLVKEGDELKVVYVGQDLEQYFDSDFQFYYLQPCFVAGDPEQTEKNIQMTIEKIKEDTRWILSLQTHKMLNIQ